MPASYFLENETNVRLTLWCSLLQNDNMGRNNSVKLFILLVQVPRVATVNQDTTAWGYKKTRLAFMRYILISDTQNMSIILNNLVAGYKNLHLDHCSSKNVMHCYIKKDSIWEFSVYFPVTVRSNVLVHWTPSSANTLGKNQSPNK